MIAGLIVIAICVLLLGGALVNNLMHPPQMKAALPPSRAPTIEIQGMRNLYNGIEKQVNEIRDKGDGCPDIDLSPTEQILTAAYSLAAKGSEIWLELCKLPKPEASVIEGPLADHFQKWHYTQRFFAQPDEAEWTATLRGNLGNSPFRRKIENIFPFAAKDFEDLNDSIGELRRIKESLNGLAQEISITVYKYERFLKTATPTEIHDWRDALSSINGETKALKEAIATTEG